MKYIFYDEAQYIVIVPNKDREWAEEWVRLHTSHVLYPQIIGVRELDDDVPAILA
jgi:hypothetical protein